MTLVHLQLYIELAYLSLIISKFINQYQFINLIPGLDQRGSCDFDDQCLSHNCHKNQCECNANDVYIHEKNLCVFGMSYIRHKIIYNLIVFLY